MTDGFRLTLTRRGSCELVQWTRKATDASKTAMVASGLATNVHAAADLPSRWPTSTSDYAGRSAPTRRDARDRLDKGTRTTAAPPRLETSRNCASKFDPDSRDFDL